MENNTEDFSPEKSLALIQTMIDKTRDSVADKSFYFLLWGWLVFVAALLQFVLKVHFHSPNHPVAWNLMFVGAIVSALYSRKERGKKRVKTYVDDSIRYLWIAVGICQGLFIFIFARNGNWQDCYTFFMLLYGLGCFITGSILKFPPLVWGAVASWMLVILSTFTTYDQNILLLAVAILVSYIIPGYLLRREHQRSHH